MTKTSCGPSSASTRTAASRSQTRTAARLVSERAYDAGRRMTTTAKPDAATELDRSASTRSGRSRWTRSRRRTRATRGRRWRSPRSPTCSTRASCATRPSDPDWPNRDRFVLSAGHASMLLYSLLYLTGYGLDARGHQELPPARLADRRATPSTATLPGIEATTGPLGQGIATCTGLALGRAHAERAARRRRASTTTRSASPPTATSRRASRPKAGSLAGHLKLGRLIAFYDDNHITIEGETALAFSEDVGKRYEAYGWHVQNLGEDLALDRIEQAARTAMEVADAPSPDHLPHAHRATARRTSRTPRGATARPSGRRR